MHIYIEIYGIRVRVFTENTSLQTMIQKYYEAFLVPTLEEYDVDIKLERYWYLSKKELLNTWNDFSCFWDGVKINPTTAEYFFSDQEVSWMLKFSDDMIEVKGKLIPHKLRHLIHITLQWITRIDKFYNRFLMKTCIHDIIFILLEKKLKSCLLHATVATNGKKTFLFTWLGGSWKSTMASALSHLKGYTILSDNYAIVSGNTVYPFPELPRITKGTQKLLWINLSKKADGIKNYLENNVSNLEEKYSIDAIFICSYSKEYKVSQIKDKQYLFELLYSINNYTKEFPEYLNLALLSVIYQFNTNKERIENLEKIIEANAFFMLQNNKDLEKNINSLLNV